MDGDGYEWLIGLHESEKCRVKKDHAFHSKFEGYRKYIIYTNKENTLNLHRKTLPVNSIVLHGKNKRRHGTVGYQDIGPTENQDNCCLWFLILVN